MFVCSVDKQIAENLAQDMADLMHDFDVVSRLESMLLLLSRSLVIINLVISIFLSKAAGQLSKESINYL